MKDLQQSIRRAAAALAVALCAACGAVIEGDAEPADERQAPAAEPAVQEPVRSAPPSLERAPRPERPWRQREPDELLPPLFDERRPPEVRRDRPPQMRVA